VRLPESLIERLDSVAFDLKMPSRACFIRRSLDRALEYSEQNEVPLVQDPALRRALSR
jgi:metal-responsive CopG/Arc/MetJ family transcriptional regulator